MKRKCLVLTLAMGAVVALPAAAAAGIIGQHHFSWWDDPQMGVMVTPQNLPPPTPNSILLLNLDEWHLDQPQTTAWYNGLPILGLPPNPFNPANRTGMTPGSVPAPVAGAEGFIYQIKNINYGSGNANAAGLPFSFTDPVPPGPGVNDLSGINIIDTWGALNVSPALPNSQFMFTTLLGPSAILDLTPGSVVAPQDWDFNAFAGPGNFEWDISPANGAGVVMGLPSGVFGFAMPGNWLDAVNDGWVHSWNPMGPAQVNIANGFGGFSGPRVIPEPATLAIVILSGAFLCRRKRRRKA